MNIVFVFILETAALLIGLALLIFARPLSVRFGAPPTSSPTARKPRSGQSLHPAASTLDPNVLVTVFRVAGTFLILGTLIPLLAIVFTLHR